MAANFLSALSPIPVDGRVYVEPAEMLEFALSHLRICLVTHSFHRLAIVFIANCTEEYDRGSVSTRANAIEH